MTVISRLVRTGILLAASAAAMSPVAAEDAAIRASSIRAHLGFLANDLLEGREAGTRGYDLAANDPIITLS